MTGRRQCGRYRHDGTPCVNSTVYADGWCRQPDCPGYLRPQPATAPEGSGSFRGTARHLREAPATSIDLAVDTAHDVYVTTRAVDSFRFHHGGGVGEAQAQLRSMLEDFLIRSVRTVKNGYTTLSRDGFDLVLGPDNATITGYRTAHRERTWAQVNAGVRSRFTKPSAFHLSATGQRPEPGPALPPEEIPSAVRPETVHLTGVARTAYAKLRNLRDPEDESRVDELLRKELVAVADGIVQAIGDGGAVFIDTPGLRWLFSSDARTLITVKPDAEPQAPRQDLTQ
jgi:hypothetical protein